MFRELIRVTGNATHHFFAVLPHSMLPIEQDQDGVITVYTDRAKCEAGARKIVGAVVAIAVVGMGDEKWALFQREEKYRVVS